MSGGSSELANISTSRGVSRKSLTRSAASNQKLSLENLEDDLLIEILCRIPTTESAFRCKLVCKHWCSIISSTHFVSSFIDQHDDHDDGDGSEYQKPLGIIVTRLYPSTWDDCSTVTIDSVNPDFRRLNLDYLPQDRGSVVVVASCNDLILCKAVCNNEKRFVDSLYCYYLCNPFTMKWLSFPPPPPERQMWPYGVYGLICEPYSQRGGGINVAYRYRVVSFSLKGISDDPERVPVWTYHSETSQWIESELSGGVYSFGSAIVAHNGKFHWVNRDGAYLVTYDPFNMGQTSLIDGPDFSAPICPMSDPLVGECNGVLRVIRMEVCSDMTSMNLNVWDLELEDGDNSHELRLVLKHSVPFETIFAHNSWPREISDDDRFFASCCLAFHPTNMDVVYLSLTNCDFFTSYNLHSKELKVEGQFIGVGHFSYKLFPVALSWWPTPILDSVSPISSSSFCPS